MSDKIPLTNSSQNSSSLSPTHSPSTKYELHHIDSIQKQLDEVKQITANNIDKVLERGERIEVLVDSSERLQHHSVQFHKRARNLKKTMCCKKIKLYIFIGCIGSLFIYIMAALICGHSNLKEC